MTPRERFLAAVEGRPVDRLPVSAWVHFLSDHLSGRETAWLHARFLKAYGWDFAKVMNDYRWPVPADVRSFEDPATLRGFGRIGLDHPMFAQQLECLTQLRAAMGSDFPLLETGFDPYQQLLRNIGRDQAPHLWRHREETLRALEAICESTCDYVRELKARGIEGFFYSINSAIPENFPRGSSREVYELFERPFDLEILGAAEGMVRVLHVHGSGLDLDRVRDYPFEVIHLADRHPDNPSLAQMRAWTDRCVMGGIDEARFTELSLAAIAEQVDDAIAQAGRERFILAPGCTLPSFSARRSLEFLGEYVRSR